MILTWKEINSEVLSWSITIDPFREDQTNPNSYNYSLSNKLKVWKMFDGLRNIFDDVVIPKEWLLLKRGQMYLWSTQEIIGSEKYMISLIWRSSIWRLWMFLQLSANVLHTWTCHKITLEIYPIEDIIVYPYMIIGQISFRTNCGDIIPYDGYYTKRNEPQESYLSNYIA